jgi:hypothetical protein
MARLPDRFDLWVRKARQCPDPFRQADYVLGALSGLQEWHFLNVGTLEMPRAAEAQIETESYLLVFSDFGRVEEMMMGKGDFSTEEPMPIIALDTAKAMAWCVERRSGLLVNPGEEAILIPASQLKAFHHEWTQRVARQASGYWIPNMTTAEEDFWEEHGL